MSDLLIIQYKSLFRNYEDYKIFYERLMDQKANGFILLPPSFEVLLVPEGVDIQLKTPDKTYSCPVANEDRDKVALCYKWIPCSERLPEEKGQYLVTREVDFNYPSLATFNPSNDHWYTLSGFASISKVIAWMPLPDIYKGE